MDLDLLVLLGILLALWGLQDLVHLNCQVYHCYLSHLLPQKVLKDLFLLVHQLSLFHLHFLLVLLDLKVQDYLVFLETLQFLKVLVHQHHQMGQLDQLVLVIQVLHLFLVIHFHLFLQSYLFLLLVRLHLVVHLNQKYQLDHALLFHLFVLLVHLILVNLYPLVDLVIPFLQRNPLVLMVLLVLFLLVLLGFHLYLMVLMGLQVQ